MKNNGLINEEKEKRYSDILKNIQNLRNQLDTFSEIVTAEKVDENELKIYSGILIFNIKKIEAKFCKKLTIQDLLIELCNIHNVDIINVLRHNKIRGLVQVREIYAYITFFYYVNIKGSLISIDSVAKLIERDRTNIIYHARKIEGWLKNDKKYKASFFEKYNHLLK